MKKLLLSILFASTFLGGIGQTVFINEIDYDNLGTDASEGIEVAGPAGTDLTGYSIEFYNGSTGASYNNVPLSGIIPNQDNGYGTLDFNSGGTINWLQNGAPDGVALIDPSLNVVQFLSYEGSLTATDSYASGLTSDDILVADDNVSDGSPQLTGVGTTYTDFTWTFVPLDTKGNVNTGQSFGGSLPPTVFFDVVSVSISEAIGTVTVNINITNEDINPTSADVVLGVSTATGGGVDFTYSSPTTVTFPANSTAQQTVTVTIVDDASTETLETIVLELQNVTNNGVVGNNSSHTISITDNDAPVIPACSELFISEYMEGTGFNKVIEIYNPTISVIDLNDYEIRLYGNGSVTPTATVNPAGSIVPGDVFVIANGQAQASLLLEADITSSVANFNGDDALELYKISTGTVVDVVGESGTNPGTEWVVGTGSTLNNVLVRMSSIDAGSSLWTGFVDAQWDVYTTADTLFVGSHTNTGCATALPLTAYPVASTDTICIGDTVYFTNSTFGGTAPSTPVWDFGDGNTSLLDNPYHAYATGGMFTISLGVVDGVAATDNATLTMFVNSLPTVTATSDTTICVGGAASLEAIGGGGAIPFSYDWSDGSTGSPVSVIPTTSTSYNVMVTDSNGCSAFSSLVTVDLYQPLTAGISAASNLICEGESVQVTATATGGLAPYSYAWVPTGTGAVITDSPTADTTYTVVISDACESANDTTSVMVIVNQASANYSFTGEPTVSFTDLSLGNIATYLWDFGDGNTSNLSDPANTYTSNGTYTVCLTITTTEGCADSICQPLQITGTGVNAFDLNTITIFPNPTSNNQVTIANQNNEVLSIIISNAIGQTVWGGTISKTETFNLPKIQKGNYFVRITSEKGTITKKLMVK